MPWLWMSRGLLQNPWCKSWRLPRRKTMHLFGTVQSVLFMMPVLPGQLWRQRWVPFDHLPSIYTHNSLCIAAAMYSWLCQDGISVDWAALDNWSVFPTRCVFYKWADPSLLLDTVWPPIVRACNRSWRIPSIRCSQSVYLTNSQVIEQKLTCSTGVVKNYIQKTLKLKKQTSVLLLQKFCKWQLHT